MYTWVPIHDFASAFSIRFSKRRNSLRNSWMSIEISFSNASMSVLDTVLQIWCRNKINLYLHWSDVFNLEVLYLTLFTSAFLKTLSIKVANLVRVLSCCLTFVKQKLILPPLSALKDRIHKRTHIILLVFQDLFVFCLIFIEVWRQHETTHWDIFDIEWVWKRISGVLTKSMFKLLRLLL